MGLVDLKTNLKSLKYDSGNKPFITKDINNPPSNSGIVDEAARRVDDVVRVTQALLPANTRFLANQVLLEQVNFSQKINSVKLAQVKTTAGAVLQRVKNAVLLVPKITASTLLQTAGAGTGLHVLRGLRSKSTGRESVSSLALNGEAIATPDQLKETQALFSIPDVANKKSFELDPLGIDYIRKDKFTSLDPYSMSPENATRLAVTGSTINTSIITGDVAGSLKNKPSELDPILIISGSAVRTTLNIDAVGNTRPRTVGTTLPISDFRQGNESERISFNYQKPTIKAETRVGLGNQGYLKKPNSYTITNEVGIDKVNFQDVVKVQQSGTEIGGVRDFIKFRFEVLNPDGGSTFLYFRAFLENFDDNFQGDWTEQSYLGRADKFQVYQGFSRNINVNFKIAAATRMEMKPLYKKMVFLASTTAPSYGSDGAFMRGTIVRMTIGSYIYEMPGVITSVSYNWNEKYPWEIAMQNPENNVDDDMQELPHILDCSVAFRVIHDFTAETGLKHYMTLPRAINNAKPFF
jgi:hypothetical protein